MNCIKEYKKACQKVADEFMKLHFDEPEWFWVGNEVGDVININEYYFSMDDMVDFLQYRYSSKKMFEYYDYRMDEKKWKKFPVNIKNFKKMKNL